MVPIPENMKFKRDKRAEKRLLVNARKFLAGEGRSEGIHASDLLDPRKAYFRYKTGDKEASLTDSDVMRFYTGKVLHMMILGQADEGSKPCDLGFEYSVDLMDKKIPTEFKSTSTAIKKDVNDPGMRLYLEQLMIYMAVERSTKGKLWVLFMNARDETFMRCPQFRCATIEVTNDDLQKVRDYCSETTRSLKESLKGSNFGSLPLCRETYCSRQYCQWYDECKPEGRWKPKRQKRTTGSGKAQDMEPLVPILSLETRTPK